MVFYKMSGQEMVFQLVDNNVREDFALWDNTNKRFIRQLEGVADINDIKFMKQDLFQQRYPSLRKNTRYIRGIVVYDSQQPTQYLFGFKKTANDDLNKFITNQRNIGINPLEILLKLRKTGIGIDTTYSIVALEKIGLPQNVQQSSQPYSSQLQPQGQQSYQTPITPVKMPIITPNKPTSGFEIPKQIQNMQPVIALSEKEQVVYGLACEYQGRLSEQDFVIGFKYTYHKIWNEDISSLRVMDIYSLLYCV